MHRFILLLALVSGSGLANAADGAARAEKEAQAGVARESTESAKQDADEAKAAPADAEAKPQAKPTPRRPDTAGWRRIMAGSGRT